MSIPGPYEWTSKRILVSTAFPSNYLEQLRRTMPNVDSMGVALVNVNAPGVAYSINFAKTGFAASLPKIAAMYASYYLRYRLKDVYSDPSLAGKPLKELEAVLRKEWAAEMRAKLPATANDFPDITAIFSGTDFKFSKAHGYDLTQMVQASDNWAAGRVIHRVGYDYLNGCLVHGGFYSPANTRGLWLAGDYIPTKSPINRDGKSPKGLGTSQAASAETTALMLVNLALGELINTDASEGMRKLMNNASSWVRDLVQKAHSGAEVFGKVGVGGAPYSAHDCAIVKYGRMHYVVVALFGTTGINSLLSDLDATAQRLF